MWNFGSGETMLGEYGQYQCDKCSTPPSIQYRYFDEPKDEAILKPRWPSPAYKGLIGDVLPEFLCFSEFPFPDPPTAPCQPFPSLGETHAYLHAFAEPYLKDGKIKLNREVVKVLEREQGKMEWSVTYREWDNDGREVEEVWDAVVVAVGWYDTPVWPNTEGLEELKQLGLAKHAKWFRGKQPEYEGKVSYQISSRSGFSDRG
jgi:cation diffusion facilitator CzcD-associated flavoprotein CzcO